jgi:galactokinase
MTGGGFGGCTVNLVERRSADAFQDRVSRDYQAHAKTRPDIFIAEASDGAGELSINDASR